MHHTLSALGATDIDTYFLPKGDNIHTPEASEALSAYNAAALIVLDQGSRAGPAILPGVPTLILDHHQSTVFPEEAQASMLPLPSSDLFTKLLFVQEQLNALKDGWQMPQPQNAFRNISITAVVTAVIDVFTTAHP